MEPSLDGVKAKFEHAKRHANLFEEKYKEWRASMVANPPVTIEKNPSPRRPTFVITAPLPDPTLSLIIGDCVHNLRICLDHLAGQLALKDGHDVNTHSTLAFPICATEAEYKKSADRNIKPFIKNQKVLDMIDATQPYHRKNPKTDPLWVLMNLDNIDKHRTLVVVAPRINKRETFEDKSPAEDVKENAVSHGPYTMVFQAEVWPANFTTAREAGQAARTITIWTDATLVFANTELLCDNWSVPKSLQLLFTRVQRILYEFEKRFFQ